MSDALTEIKRAIELQRVSRKRLAFEAGISESSLEKILSGNRPLSFGALSKLEAALGLEPASPSPQRAQIAPEDHGAYTRTAVRWMEGAYLAVRHSFHADGALIAFAVMVGWDEAHATLSFITSDDFTGPALQRGRVSFSTRTGHSYFVTSDLGRFDLMVLGRPAEGGRLSGLCTTAFLERGSPIPASSAITFAPIELEGALPVCGRITPDAAEYAIYLEWLRVVERDGQARLARAPEP